MFCKKIPVILFVTVFLLLFSNSSYSQTGILRGRVTDSTGEAFSGVHIFLNRHAQKEIVLVTDGHGRFLHKKVPTGIYDLLIVAPGYEKQEVRGVVIFEGGIVNQYIRMTEPWKRPDYDDGYGRLPGDCD